MRIWEAFLLCLARSDTQQLQVTLTPTRGKPGIYIHKRRKCCIQGPYAADVYTYLLEHDYIASADPDNPASIMYDITIYGYQEAQRIAQQYALPKGLTSCISPTASMST